MHLKKKSIIFFTPYPIGQAPSQRFRFEQYFHILKGGDIHFTVYPFLTQTGWSTLYTKGKVFQKGWHLAKGLASRLWHVILTGPYDYVFIHREVIPVGPPIFEWIIVKVLRKKIIYDFDDAIWLTDKITQSKVEKIIRHRTKVSRICKWSYKISCGNEYLANYAKRFNPNTIVNPTTIDTVGLHNPSCYTSSNHHSYLTIGWTGSHSTLKYLKHIEPVIFKLQEKYSHVNLLIIADQKPTLNIKRLEFIPWNKNTEAENLLQVDIGIMPLPDDEWTKGKCGFKALQYMAMEKPAVVSAVGVNTTIVDHGVNGYLVYHPDEWLNYLEKLILDETLRAQMGKNGRLKVNNQYSVTSNTPTFLSLFE